MERKYLLSSDIIGIAGPPWHMQDIAGFTRNDPDFKGIEQIAWHTSRVWQFFLEHSGFKVVGKHGRLGGALQARGFGDAIKVLAADQLLQTETHLFSSFGNSRHLDYVLLHAPRAEDDKVRRLIREYAQDSRFFLFIENHSVKKGLGGAKEIVREVRSDGMENVGLMFDLVHYINPNLGTNSFDTMWRRAMWEIGDLRDFKDREGKPIRIALHVPIGINGFDSLLVGTMKGWHWELLAEKLAGRDVLIVLENQHESFVVLSRGERYEESRRLEDVVGVLKRRCVIGASSF